MRSEPLPSNPLAGEGIRYHIGYLHAGQQCGQTLGRQARVSSQPLIMRLLELQSALSGNEIPYLKLGCGRNKLNETKVNEMVNSQRTLYRCGHHIIRSTLTYNLTIASFETYLIRVPPLTWNALRISCLKRISTHEFGNEKYQDMMKNSTHLTDNFYCLTIRPDNPISSTIFQRTATDDWCQDGAWKLFQPIQ